MARSKMRTQPSQNNAGGYERVCIRSCAKKEEDRVTYFS